MEALKKLDVWRRACRLSVDIYATVDRCRNAGFRDQLGRSGLSIASNIAEGYGREGFKERIQLLRVAKASCSEAWSQVWVGSEAGFIEKHKALQLADEIEQISRMIHGLIRHLAGAGVPRPSAPGPGPSSGA